jgi:hypothetical protein
MMGLVLLAASCGGGGSASPSAGTAPSGPTSSPATAVADPLVGVWRQDYSCQDQVRTFMRKIRRSTPEGLQGLADGKHLHSAEPGVIIAAYASEFAWGPNADATAPTTASIPATVCKGAPDKSKLMRVQDGLMAFVVPDPAAAGVVSGELVATYRLIDDHTFTASDGDRDIDGTETFSFSIEGDRLTIRQPGADAWTGTAFEMAPFVRVS